MCDSVNFRAACALVTPQNNIFYEHSWFSANTGSFSIKVKSPSMPVVTLGLVYTTTIEKRFCQKSFQKNTLPQILIRAFTRQR